MMRDLPGRVVICGVPYTVTFCDRLVERGTPVMGLCDTDTDTVFIARRFNGTRQTKAQQWDTLVHEIIHGVLMSDREPIERFVETLAAEVAKALTQADWR